MLKNIEKIQDPEIGYAVLKNDLTYIRETIMEIRTDIKEIKTQYATKTELLDVKNELNERIDPIAKVFSTVSLAILLIAVSAFIYLVATHPVSLLAK